MNMQLANLQKSLWRNPLRLRNLFDVFAEPTPWRAEDALRASGGRAQLQCGVLKHLWTNVRTHFLSHIGRHPAFSPWCSLRAPPLGHFVKLCIVVSELWSPQVYIHTACAFTSCVYVCKNTYLWQNMPYIFLLSAFYSLHFNVDIHWELLVADAFVMTCWCVIRSLWLFPGNRLAVIWCVYGRKLPSDSHTKVLHISSSLRYHSI